jgi:hypothetical protein
MFCNQPRLTSNFILATDPLVANNHLRIRAAAPRLKVALELELDFDRRHRLFETHRDPHAPSLTAVVQLTSTTASTAECQSKRA